MITYIDTSTLLKLLIEEDGSAQAEVIWSAADVWRLPRSKSPSTVTRREGAVVGAAVRPGRRRRRI